MTERREWLDEWEEAGWTKEVSAHGAICYSKPVSQALMQRMPDLPTTFAGRTPVWRLRRWLRRILHALHQR